MADWAAIAGIGANVAGVAGLTLSVLNYLDRRKDSRPSLKVLFDVERSHGSARVGVHAVNTRQRMVRVEEAGLLLPNKDKLQFNSNNVPAIGMDMDLAGDSMPHELGPGQKCSRYMYAEAVNAQLSKAGYGEGVMLRGYAVPSIRW